jgi:hypothetical protein
MLKTKCGVYDFRLLWQFFMKIEIVRISAILGMQSTSSVFPSAKNRIDIRT